MSIGYIRKTYGVPAKRGGAVTYHDSRGLRHVGHICGASSPYVAVRMLGEKHSRRIHPTDPGLTYLLPPTGLPSSAPDTP